MSAVSVFVTGGAGFVGSCIIDALQEYHPEWTISVFDLKSPETPKSGVKYFTGDVTNLEDVRNALREVRPLIVIHTAGLVPPLAHRYIRALRDKVFHINVDGTKNMLAAAKEFGAKAFVWTSSVCAVTDNMKYQYPNIDESWPTSGSGSLIYGESKAIVEPFVLAANEATFATCSIRPSVLLGPDDYQLVPSIHSCIDKGETPFVIGSGENLWDVTYVTNVADAHVLAAENLITSKTAAGQAIFISNNEPITFRDLCLAIWANFGHHPPYEVHIPGSLAVAVGYIAEWVAWLMGKPYTISGGSVLDACGMRYVTGQKAAQLLGYKPRVGIEEGIRLSCERYKEILKERSKIGNRKPINEKIADGNVINGKVH